MEDDIPIMESLQSPTTKEFLALKRIRHEKLKSQVACAQFEKRSVILESLIKEGEAEMAAALLEASAVQEPPQHRIIIESSILKWVESSSQVNQSVTPRHETGEKKTLMDLMEEQRLMNLKMSNVYK